MRDGQSALNPAKAAGAAGYVVVFSFPSAGALALTWSVAWAKPSLGIVWVFAVLVLAFSAAVGFVVESKELVPGDRRPHRDPRPPPPSP
jgi:Flp pilus assembly protein TadB